MDAVARKEWLALAERRARPGEGSRPAFLSERTARRAAPDVRFLLGGATFAVVGGWATRRFMPERQTLDLDILTDDLPYISLPYLVLMKLVSGRLQDLADIGRMLGGAAEPERDAVRAVIRRYRPRDAEDMESLIRLGQRERESQPAIAPAGRRDARPTGPGKRMQPDAD